MIDDADLVLLDEYVFLRRYAGYPQLYLRDDAAVRGKLVGWIFGFVAELVPCLLRIVDNLEAMPSPASPGPFTHLAFWT